jgi:uracil-DNA glycosylase family 4
MGWTGWGKRKVLVVAESPGEAEDEKGVQLIGRAGQKLRKHLGKIGVDLDEDCWKTNAVICRPSENETTDEQIEACRPSLNKTLMELKPDVIVLLGGAAVKSLIGSIWWDDEGLGGISRWAGFRIPSQELNAWICPTWHSSYLLRQDDPVLEFWFDQHLKAVFELEGKPWPNGPPDFQSQVECIYEGEEAEKRIQRMTRRGGVFTFDYETNRLKPDGEGARIFSCAICRDGEETIAFPWMSRIKQVMSEFLQSEHEKWGWNIKFEQRWTRVEFGHGVRNWGADGMLMAHILDNRSKVGAKFNGFVLWGQPAWHKLVSPYLKSDRKGGNENNRINELDLRDLLIYNGMDAVMEWFCVDKQLKLKKEMMS